MLSVNEALKEILDRAKPLGEETLSIDDIAGRCLAKPVTANITQPAFRASAMDGYAVRFDDAKINAKLSVIGESTAGTPSNLEPKSGEAVRIFTGAVVPEAADHVVIQEDVSRDGDEIVISAEQTAPRHIRNAGIDFNAGDVLASAGDICSPLHISIFATANITQVVVHRRCKTAVFSNGNELRKPGSVLELGEIIDSNHYAVTGLSRQWGADAQNLGRAGDSQKEVLEFFERARSKEVDADVIVPIGGASVGDYDFVVDAFKDAGGEIIFQKIAMKPGKPTWFGRLGDAFVLGLPGNPASAIVAASLFLQPLTRALVGEAPDSGERDVVLSGSVDANGPREAFLRARITTHATGVVVTPVSNQDSSLLTPFTSANALIRRKPHDSARSSGDIVPVIILS